MSPGFLVLLLFAIGVVLIIAEALLPTHGVLAVVGLGAVAGAVGVCFWIDQWLGVGVLLALLIVSPFVGSWMVQVWPKTPIGRRIILQHTEGTAPASVCDVSVGQTGVAVTELRPVGECEFGEQRCEAISEYGLIEVGQKVRVVGVTANRPTVRSIPEQSAATDSAA